jgi:hypothetical protein
MSNAAMTIAAATPTRIQMVRLFFESAAVADASARIAGSARDCAVTALLEFTVLDTVVAGARGRLAATVL